jgi:hypothetical protein
MRDNITSPNVWPDTREDRRVHPEDWLGMAESEWLGALHQSQMAPPDAWFASRLQLLAESAARKAGALALFDDDEPMTWEHEPAVDALTLSYELRPGGNRPGPPDLWAQFDRRVEALGRAMKAARAGVIRTALDELSLTLQDLADEIRAYRGQWGNWENGPVQLVPSEGGEAPESGLGGVERSVS